MNNFLIQELLKKTARKYPDKVAIEDSENTITFKSLNDIMNWCFDNIKYKIDIGGKEYWQTPQETYDLRTGDCEDYVILFMQFAYELGYKSELITIKTKKGTYHTLAKVEGKFYNVNANEKYDRVEDMDIYKELHEDVYSYNETMYYTVKGHATCVYK